MVSNVVFDFDGVIHSYTSGWKGAGIIPDPPVPGVKELIAALRTEGYNVIVQSTRCTEREGMQAVKQYLEDNEIEVDDVVAHKPPAIVYIDDRAICFDGHPETLLDKIKNFKVWNHQPKFQESWILGERCLFSIERIERSEYPRLNRYELMYEGEGDVVAIQTDVLANFYGTILSEKQLIDSKSNKYYVNNGNLGMMLDERDVDITNNFITMTEYMEV